MSADPLSGAMLIPGDEAFRAEAGYTDSTPKAIKWTTWALLSTTEPRLSPTKPRAMLVAGLCRYALQADRALAWREVFRC